MFEFLQENKVLFECLYLNVLDYMDNHKENDYHVSSLKYYHTKGCDS